MRDCISSITKAGHEGFVLNEVVVVDNGSTDDSLTGIDQLGEKVKVIRNSLNRGFGAACNQGAQSTTSDYLLFLNPDTMLFDNSLSAPITFMEQEQNLSVGICGIRLLNEEGRFATSGARFPTIRIFVGSATGLSRLIPKVFPRHLMSENECVNGGMVDQVIGAFFLVRRSVYEKLGGFDERFFVYFEEVDFALRAKNAGIDSYLLTGASAYHRGGGCTDAVKATRLFYSLRSRLQYGKKHFSGIENLELFVITFCIELAARIGVAILSLSSSQIRETLTGYGMLVSRGWRTSK